VKQTLDQIMAEVRSNYFEVLPIEDSHILMVETLPFLHRDPFDRMLIAQALTEDFTLVSNEKLFDDYGVKRIW
jgi:PIN domain nuclease of toxin-antitoxin system